MFERVMERALAFFMLGCGMAALDYEVRSAEGWTAVGGAVVIVYCLIMGSIFWERANGR